ncbi:MAG TPA: co-chaperone GroES [Candidatus Paceibacterota bacterium]|nr:co-chaperone GroES [Candidatus Paceibacterota bacterium]
MSEKKVFTACNNYVILRVEKIAPKLSEGGIIIPLTAQKEGDKHEAYLYDIGPKAEVTCKIGDRVIFNQYDAKALEDKKQQFIVCKDVSIMAVY